MKILLTGWSGFIGQHLIARLKNDATLVYLQSDLTNHRAVVDEVLLHSPDMIVHLAARTEVEQSFYEQTTFSDINYTGTVNLIESCRQLKSIPKFIFASTMEVYGWQPISDKIKNKEVITSFPILDDETPNPNAPYAVAKYGCEKYLEYAHRAYGLDYVIIRQTNAYGRKDNNYFVTEQIISQMLTNPTICNLGYKDPYRNFIFIEDLLDIWQLSIENFDKIKNDFYTVGPNMPIRIEDHAHTIMKKLKWNGVIQWDTKLDRPGEIYYLNSSSAKISKLLNWTPKVDYDTGLDKTIEFLRQSK
jgi:nucleoside-diphosphate-sugar epimerase